MPDSLVDLESRRAAVQSQIAQLGDMRSGSITGTSGRCGNPNCHCHRADDPGHGPYYRLTRKVKGKTVTETFFLRPVWPKRSARSPNASASVHWAINCWRSMNRSVRCGQWSRPRHRPRKKTSEAIRKEVTREVDRFLQ